MPYKMQRRKKKTSERIEEPPEPEKLLTDGDTTLTGEPFEDEPDFDDDIPPTLLPPSQSAPKTTPQKKKNFLFRRPGITLAAGAVITAGAAIGLFWPRGDNLPPTKPNLTRPPAVSPTGTVPDPNIARAIDPNATTADPNAASRAGPGTISSVRPPAGRIIDPNTPSVTAGAADPNTASAAGGIDLVGPLGGEWSMPGFPGTNMRLGQVDNEVKGTYLDGKGFIEGAVEGGTLKLRFWTGVEPGKPFEEASTHERGTGTFKVSSGNDGLEGQWKYDWEGIARLSTATKNTPPAGSTAPGGGTTRLTPPSPRTAGSGVSSGGASGPVVSSGAAAASTADPNAVSPVSGLIKLDEPQRVYKLTSKSGYNFLVIKGREDSESVELINLYTPKGNLLRDEYPKPIPDEVVMGGRRKYRTQDLGAGGFYSLTEMTTSVGEPVERDVFYEPELSPEEMEARQWQRQLDGLSRQTDAVKAEAGLQRARNDLASLRGARIIDRAEYNRRLEQIKTDTVQERRERRYRRW